MMEPIMIIDKYNSWCGLMSVGKSPIEDSKYSLTFKAARSSHWQPLLFGIFTHFKIQWKTNNFLLSSGSFSSPPSLDVCLLHLWLQRSYAQTLEFSKFICALKSSSVTWQLGEKQLLISKKDIFVALVFSCSHIKFICLKSSGTEFGCRPNPHIIRF